MSAKEKGTGDMNLRKMKLATKTSLAVAIVLMISLTILIIVSVLSVSREMKKTIDGEFAGFSTQNGIIVQSIIDDAASVAQNLRDYLEEAYGTYGQMLANQTVDANGNKMPFVTRKSALYDANLVELNYEVENYILHNAWSIVKNNLDIVGIGAYFEPYAYDEAIRDYSIYVDDGGAENKTAEIALAYEEYKDEEWYSMAATTQKDYFTKPYVENDITMVTASFPIISSGKTQGVILVDINVDQFSRVKSTDAKYETMFTNILTQEGVIVYDSESSEFVGQDLAGLLGGKQYENFREKAQAGSAFQMETAYDGGALVQYYYPIQAGEQVWWSSTSLEQRDLNKEIVQLAVLMVAVAVVILILIILSVFVLLRRMLKPVDGLVTAAESIVKGELDISLDIRSEDEIGMLSRAFEAMSDNLKRIISEVGYLLDEMARGNFQLQSQYEDCYVGEYGKILLAMRGINRNLSHTLTEINAAAHQVSLGSDQLSSGAQSLSQGATEQASSVEELSATLLEITRRVEESTEKAALASQLSHEAGEGVRESDAHMDVLMSAMREISGASTEIGKIDNSRRDHPADCQGI